MHVTRKGQITVPVELRRKYGITPDVDVTFEETERGPLIVVEKDDASRRFHQALERMQGTADFLGLTTDEYMNMMRGYDEDADDAGFAA